MSMITDVWGWLVSGTRQGVIDILRITVFIATLAILLLFIVLLLSGWQLTLSPAISFRGASSAVPQGAVIVDEPLDLVQWHKRKFVADTASSYLQPVESDLKSIREKFPDFVSRGMSSCVLKQPTGELIVKQESLYIAIVHHLNYLEGLAFAYLSGVADAKLFEKAFREDISKWLRRYAGALPTFTKDCGCKWDGLKEVIDKWKPDNNPESKECTLM
jgi:hypothetical protein